MKTKSYTIIRNNYSGKITLKNYKKIEGYKINPKNSFKYKGIAVKSMILIKPSFIEKIVKKKIKRKQTLWRNKKFREVGWNLKDQKGSKKETSKRLTKHHEPKGQSEAKAKAMSICRKRG